MDLNIQQTPLTKYNLKRNPFPNVGIPNDPVSVYIGREDVLRILEDAIKGTLLGSSSHIVIIGSYGNGKTTTLKFAKSQIDKQLKNALSLYLSNPGETFLDLYRELIYELGLTRLKNFVWRYIELVTAKKNLRKKIDNGELLITEVLEVAKNRLHQNLRYADFATAFLQLILDETRLLSWKYLCGEPIVLEQRRELDVVTLIDSDEKALRAFMALKSVLKTIGYDMICIMVDELEAIEVLHPTRKQRILNSIRRLIDLNPTGLCLILACAPEVWNTILRDYHAFSERIFRQAILKPLNNEIIRDFIVAYLKQARLKSDKKGGTYPFADDAVREILRAVQGNLRRVLMVCNRAIDNGSEEGFPLITAKMLRNMFPDFFEQ